MKSLIAQYIEISSEEEMEKASKWLESKGYECTHDKIYYKDGTYLFIASNNKFHFNHGNEKSFWKPFSILYDEGMPRDEEDLLTKAKRLYPIGTKYKCAAGGHAINTVESMNWAPSPSDHIYGEYGKGCIYKHGKWAEILHEVKPIEKKEEPKFEVGKWYKPTQNSKAYRRCSKVVLNKAGFEYDYFISGVGYIAQAGVGNTGWIDVHLATMEEIQVYLPKGHPDLIVKPIEEWSVGSYVVFLTDEVKTNSSAEITKGKPYRINDKNYDLLYCKGNNSKIFNFFWEQEECRWFPTLEEAEAFSNLIKEKVYSGDLSNYIGRYLEALVDSPHGGTVKKGEYGLIINEQQVNFPRHKGYTCSKALSESNLNINYRLMPEGFTPPPESKCLNMSKDELLEYTKKKYPIGCKVKFPGYNERIISQELFWQYDSWISHSGCCPVLDITDGNYIWAEIIEMPEVEPYNRVNIGSNISSITYSYTGPTEPQKETHQSINKTGRQFSPIKVELIKVKQLKIN